MANLVEKIPVIIDGESAYDFRLKANQAIAGVNDAFEQINSQYDYIVDVNRKFNSLMESVARAQNQFDVYVETTAKPEIEKYFEDFIDNKVEDLSTVQLRRNKPEKDSTGYLPDFWYEIIDGSGPLVLNAKLVTKSNVFSDLKLSKEHDWSITSESWSIDGSFTYDSTKTPNAVDIIGLVLVLEDGSEIIAEKRTNNDFDGIAPSNTGFVGIQPEYDVNTKTIYWNFGRLSSWLKVGNKLQVDNVQITDGVITQTFNINITFAAK